MRLLWLLPSGGIGILIYLLLGALSEGEPTWLRIVWGVTAFGTMLFIGKVRW